VFPLEQGYGHIETYRNKKETTNANEDKTGQTMRRGYKEPTDNQSLRKTNDSRKRESERRENAGH
jgi:hypothetical protein